MMIILSMYIMLTILENAFSSTNSIFTRTLGAKQEKLKPKGGLGIAGEVTQRPHQGYLTLEPSSSASQVQNMACLHVQKGLYFWGDSR